MYDFLRKLPNITRAMAFCVVRNLLADSSMIVMVSIPYVITGRMHVLNTLVYRFIGIFLFLSTSLSLPTANQLMRLP